MCGSVYICVYTAETKTSSYHAVHCEVVMLGLQLNSMLVVPSNLSVTGEEKPLVVHDPVEHLHTEEGKKTITVIQNELQMYWVFQISCLLTATAARMKEGLLFCVCN